MDNVVEMEVQAVVNKLYEKDAKEMKRMVDGIIWKYGGLSGKDKDDFYSIANDTISEVLWNMQYPKDGKTYFDPTKGDFKGYIYRAISLAIIDDIKYRNAGKRSVKYTDEEGNVTFIPTISIDAPIAEEESLTVGDFLCSKSDGFEIMDAISEGNNDFLDENVENFLNSLTTIQKKIVQYRMDGLSAKEIQDILELTKKQYEVQLKEIKSYEHAKFLRRKDTATNRKEVETMNYGKSQERQKDTHVTVSSMRRKLRNREWRDDHLLQRYSGMFNPFEKSELIVDIASGRAITQIIVSEEIKNNYTYMWLIDGKQRCTTIDSYCSGDFAISKKVQLPMIEYQVTCRDENGEFILDDGFPTYETKLFDIRGKRFDQLPEELQNQILDYPMPVLMNLNCDKETIAYDIARFNRSRAMNKSQNGWIGMDEDCALVIDKFITDTKRFKFFSVDFVGSNYTENNKKKGEMRRVVTDCIIMTYYPDEYNKDFNTTCKNFSNIVKNTDFMNFESLVNRLEKVADEETAKVFNPTNSKIWFAVFDKCKKHGIADIDFVRFVKEFNNGLGETVIDGFSYNEIGGSRDTKGSLTLHRKVEYLEKLMLNYFDLEANNFAEEQVEKVVEPTEEHEEISFELDSNWQDYIAKFSKTDLIVNSDMSDEEVIETAIQTVMILENAEELKDSTMQDYVSSAYVEDAMASDIVGYIDSLNDFIKKINHYDKLNSSNIAIMIYATSEYYRNEIEDDDFVTMLDGWLTNWNGINTTESIIQNYELIASDIEATVM